MLVLATIRYMVFYIGFFHKKMDYIQFELFCSILWTNFFTIGQKLGSYSAWGQKGSMLNLLESRAQRIFLCREGGFVGTWVYWIASRQVTSEIEIRTLTYVVESKDKWFLGGKLHNAKIRGHVKLRYFVWSSSDWEGKEGWKIWRGQQQLID